MNPKAETQISVEYDLPHPPAKVWRTLTELELLAKWIMVNDMRPVVGHRFTFKAQPTPWWDGIVHSEVLEIDLHKRLHYSWRRGPESSPLDRGHLDAHADAIRWHAARARALRLPIRQCVRLRRHEQRVAAHGWRASWRGVGGVMNTLPPTTSKTMKAQAGDNRKGARVGGDAPAHRGPTCSPDSKIRISNRNAL
jgi:uncharacterized protein YndB with AHSA1/START domain